MLEFYYDQFGNVSGWKWKDTWNTSTCTGTKCYNPEQFDLIEKKDYKKKRLDAEIAEAKKKIEICDAIIESNQEKISQLKVLVKEKEKELKEL